MNLAGTLTLDEAAQQTWDVLVIGAGPAGTLAVRQLAGGGLSVLLVERKAFPREKVCGGCLNGTALALLRRVGLHDRVAQLCGERLERFEVHAAGKCLMLPLSAGLAVSRSVFDAALAAAAIECGAAFLPETNAVVQPMIGSFDEGGPEPAVRRVHLQPQRGNPVTVSARIVIVADGLGGSSLASMPETSTEIHPQSRIGLGGAAAEADSTLRSGTICMAVAQNGYVGLVRQEHGRVNIAAAVDPGFLRECSGPAECVRRLFAQAGFTPSVDPDAIDWHGTPTLTRQRRLVADHRLFVLGDAAGYVEPFTGEGIAWALAEALEVLPLVRAGRNEWREQLILDWTKQRARTNHKRQRWCRTLAAVLRSPVAVRILMTLFSRFPRLAAPVVRKVNG